MQELLERKCSCHNLLFAKPDDQAAKTACSTLQAKLRTMQNEWWTGLAESTQRYADVGDMRSFYEALKAAYLRTLSLNGKITCQTTKSSRGPTCPAWSPSCFRCSCTGLVTSQGWNTKACPQSSSASSRRESAIVVLQESVTKTS